MNDKTTESIDITKAIITTRKLPAKLLTDFVSVEDAFEIVLDLAKQNVIDINDNPDEHKRQKEAINVIEDLAANEYGDD